MPSPWNASYERLQNTIVGREFPFNMSCKMVNRDVENAECATRRNKEFDFPDSSDIPQEIFKRLHKN